MRLQFVVPVVSFKEFLVGLPVSHDVFESFVPVVVLVFQRFSMCLYSFLVDVDLPLGCSKWFKFSGGSGIGLKCGIDRINSGCKNESTVSKMVKHILNCCVFSRLLVLEQHSSVVRLSLGKNITEVSVPVF